VGPRAPHPDALPAGLGTLHQDDITLQLKSGTLLVKVTPLDEGILRLTAPDTYARLARIRDATLTTMSEQSGESELQPFLVSFFSYEPFVTFEPEDLHLSSLGLRYRPRAIAPITPAWGAQRLDQQDTQTAVYGYDPAVGLSSDLVVEYAGQRTDGWERVLIALETERARVRLRAQIEDTVRVR